MEPSVSDLFEYFFHDLPVLLQVRRETPSTLEMGLTDWGMASKPLVISIELSPSVLVKGCSFSCLLLSKSRTSSKDSQWNLTRSCSGGAWANNTPFLIKPIWKIKDTHYIHVRCAVWWKTLYPRTCIPYWTRTHFWRLRCTARKPNNLPNTF